MIIRRKGPDPMDIHIGRQIRIRRMMLGLSQSNLGEALGLTFQQIQKYEKGTNRVSGSRLAKIVKILKLSGPNELFKGGPGVASASENSDGNAISEMMSSRNGLELARLWPKLSEKQQRAFYRVVEGVVEGD